MKFSITSIIILSTLLFACNNKSKTEPKQEQKQEQTIQVFKNKGHELIYKMSQKVGDYNSLSKNKDVIYTYTYRTPDGKADISTEKYIFNGELSYGLYDQHQRTFPDLEGQIEQGYDGSEYWLKHNGETLDDTKRLKRVAFNRPTNFYWFTMFQKLLDPGVNYEYIGEKTLNNIKYDVVKITFNSNEEKPTDIYQLYLNKNTLLVDQFLFTVADFGVMETPFLMKLQYEKIENLMIPTKRLYKKSTWHADVSDAPWIEVTWSNIVFNNNLNIKDFKK
ncbi:hypothetical protein Q4Q35_13305 [Flavivirga aquimarina]|uniref:DUF3108 domain-containing protein n=1 Tax=Flavivirga aquimarina TaxID=2027862 RepID=A0ABT8WCD7_9FLAO|nr:DUF6503 family protein [Flavivirga aquimarina]MDO5970788.1 hypothetical protein [Flavivirga aquimarina]